MKVHKLVSSETIVLQPYIFIQDRIIVLVWLRNNTDCTIQTVLYCTVLSVLYCVHNLPVSVRHKSANRLNRKSSVPNKPPSISSRFQHQAALPYLMQQQQTHSQTNVQLLYNHWWHSILLMSLLEYLYLLFGKRFEKWSRK